MAPPARPGRLPLPPTTSRPPTTTWLAGKKLNLNFCERWEDALAVVKARIASWAECQVEELPHFDIKFELQLGLLRLFVSHLFFAETLDITFLQNNIYPLPQLEFWWPYW